MERHCSVLIHYDVKGGGATVPPSEDELRTDLESSDIKDKVRGLKSLILLLLNGQSLPKLLMTVIRYCVTTRDHELKKLLSMYWEVVVKYDAEGKLLPEMILVCNAILNDLKHPNHFIRGCTLRFLCRVKDIEILQPLLPTVLENLTHSDAYVRKNAALVFFTVYQTFPDNCGNLLPDGPEIILAGLEAETDATARRNFFLFLCKTDIDLALQFYQENVSKILKFGATFHFIFLEMVRKVCRTSPEKKPMFLKTIFQLLTSSSGDGALSTAISFEAAWTLISLSSAPTAVRTATTTFIGLLNNTESDNNIKLIVLDRLTKLKDSSSENYSSGAKIIQENVLDILRVLSVPNSAIRKKALAIALDLVSPRNVKEIVQVLKKEIVRTQDKSVDRVEANAYRQELIKAIHGCAVKFPSIASTVVDLLMDFLTVSANKETSSSDSSSSNGSLEVILFVREVVETYPDLRESILTKLINLFPEISSPEVIRVSLWLLGEYTVELRLSEKAFEGIFDALDNRLFSINLQDVASEAVDASSNPKQNSSSVVILPDGTYATQTGLSHTTQEPNEAVSPLDADNALSRFLKKTDPPLRKLIIEGHYLLGTCILSCLLKIALKLKALGRPNQEVNGYTLKSIRLGCSMLQFGQAKVLPVTNRIDKDSLERINLYLKLFMDSGVSQQVKKIILGESRKSLQELLSKKTTGNESETASMRKHLVQPDQPVMFRQLKSSHKLGFEGELDDEADLNVALSKELSSTGGDDLGSIESSLQNIYQLTGFGDPIYSEAHVTVHGYDIIVDVTVINKTNKTLFDVSVELAALGNLQLMESAQSTNINAHAVHNFKTSLKVSCTDSAQIFGTISFEDQSTKQAQYISLNKISVDIMDYIVPAKCTDDEFRKMWAEFEWENKVSVNTNFDNLYSYLYTVVKATHMSCLNIPDLEEQADSFSLKRENGESKMNTLDFLAANLYAKSIFGEDALVNVSVEQVSPTKVEGFIRIRAKTQGIALILGDRMHVRK